MSDTPHDVFGKIDALLGRRAGFPPAAPALAADDIPVLTDVVVQQDAGVPVLAAAASDDSPDTSTGAEAGAELPDLGIIPPAYDLDLLAELPPDPLEERLAELVARQQAQLEAMIRRVVREELERYLGGQ